MSSIVLISNLVKQKMEKADEVIRIKSGSPMHYQSVWRFMEKSPYDFLVERYPWIQGKELFDKKPWSKKADLVMSIQHLVRTGIWHESEEVVELHSLYREGVVIVFEGSVVLGDGSLDGEDAGANIFSDSIAAIIS